MPLTLELPVPAQAAQALRERAWALKRDCHAAWSSQPQRAVLAARQLRELVAAAQHLDEASATEVLALADWGDGIAGLIQGRLEAACDALDRAAAGFTQLGQVLHAAETQVPRIMGLTLRGLHDQAARCGEAAERAFLAHGNVQAAAKVALNLGSLHLRREAPDDAVRHYRAAAVRFARVGDHEHSVMADIGLADAQAAQGRLDDAARMLARARMRAGNHGLPVLQAMADESAALMALVAGRYPDALAGFERSRAAYQQLHMPQHLAVAEKQLADAYLELRLLPEALALYDQAVARFAELDMPLEQAWALAQLGRARLLTGHRAQAEQALQRAAMLFEDQQAGGGLATVALARAELAMAGPTPDAPAALVLARAAGAAFEAAGQIDGLVRAEAQCAHALLAAGRRPEARGLYGTVLARAQAGQMLTLQAAALAGQGLVAEAEGRADDAALAFEQSLALTEAQRRALPGDEIRSAFLADHRVAFDGLLRLALADHDAGDPTAATRVLQRLDAFRARTLADRLQRPATDGAPPAAADDTGAAGDSGAVAAPATPPDRETETLRTRLNWLYRREQRLRYDGEQSPALAEHIRATEHELLERSRRRRLAGQSLPVPGGSVWTTADLRAALQDDDGVVVYGVAGDELLACLVTRRGVRLQRRLANWTEVLPALRSLRFQLDTLRIGAAPLQAHLPQLLQRAQVRLQQVHDLVWAPFADQLNGLQRVLVVPQGPLAAVPFAALHDGQQPLVARHQLALAPSVQVALHGLRRQPVAARQVRAFGVAEGLPQVQAEARRVADRFDGGRAFVGEQATLATFRHEALQADLLHLACHAEFRGDNPLFSALHLADGALTAEAVERLSLRPCNVVLSACDTARAGVDAADDRVGLVRAFLVAGAARVLASLWPVDDDRTEAFMQPLHAALAAGASPGEALRRAQLVLREQHPHPCHWAAFTLHGGW